MRTKNREGGFSYKINNKTKEVTIIYKDGTEETLPISRLILEYVTRADRYEKVLGI